MECCVCKWNFDGQPYNFDSVYKHMEENHRKQKRCVNSVTQIQHPSDEPLESCIACRATFCSETTLLMHMTSFHCKNRPADLNRFLQSIFDRDGDIDLSILEPDSYSRYFCNPCADTSGRDSTHVDFANQILPSLSPPTSDEHAKAILPDGPPPKSCLRQSSGSVRPVIKTTSPSLPTLPAPKKEVVVKLGGKASCRVVAASSSGRDNQNSKVQRFRIRSKYQKICSSEMQETMTDTSLEGGSDSSVEVGTRNSSPSSQYVKDTVAAANKTQVNKTAHADEGTKKDVGFVNFNHCQDSAEYIGGISSVGTDESEVEMPIGPKVVVELLD